MRLISDRLLGAAIPLFFGCGKPASQPPTVTPAALAVQAPDLSVLSRTAGQHWPILERGRAIEDGRAVLHRHQCSRCHTVDGQASHGRPYDCVKCHTFLKDLPNHPAKYADIAAKHGKPIVVRYLKNIQNLLQVPDLTLLGARLRPDWIGRFVREPYDVRPNAHESMYRTTVTAEEAAILVKYFAAVADVADPTLPQWQPPALPAKPDANRLTEGKNLFTTRACATCHYFGNVDFGIKPPLPVAGKPTVNDLAPNLRFVRERMTSEVLVKWLLNPQSVQPNTTMPKLGLSQTEAEILRDYLYFADPLLAPAPSLPTSPPTTALHLLPAAVARPVGWAQVKERVLGKVCVHCHMNDHENDTGPGNGGGMGYKGVGLSFRTYERAVCGALSVRKVGAIPCLKSSPTKRSRQFWRPCCNGESKACATKRRPVVTLNGHRARWA
ncbi:MAG: c-type cytochrome [Myxococcales bacterium]|nr:c-type cytochrome [Myxococcales bacterium]